MPIVIILMCLTLLVASVIQIFDGCNLAHVSGIASSSVEMSLCLSICAPILLYQCLHVLKWKKLTIIKRHVAIASIIAFIWALVFIIIITSRASWVAAVTGCTTACYLYFTSKSKLYKPKSWHVLVGLTLCVLLAFCSYYIKKDSADGRMLIWKVSARELFSGNITLLPRDGNFSTFIGDAQEKYFSIENRHEHEQMIAGAPTTAYNEFLQILIEWGVLPFVLIIGFLIAIIVLLYKTHNPKSISWLSSIVSIIVLSSMSYPIRCTISLHLILFVIGGGFLYLIRPIRLRILCLLTITSILGFSVINKIHNRKRIEETLEQCRRFELISSQCSSKKMRKCYHELYPTLKNEPEYLLSYAKQEYFSGCYKHSIFLLNKAKQLSGDPIFSLMEGKCQQAVGKYKQAEKFYFKAYYRIPHKIYPLYLLMNLYDETNNPTNAIKIARQIVSMKPKVKSAEFEYIQDEAKSYLNH